MYSVAAAALFALAIAAAPEAFAEDRSAKADAGHPPEGEIHTPDVSGAARGEDAMTSNAQAVAPSPGACRGPAQTASAAEGCEGDRRNGYSLIRGVDWSAVGPSTDDFAPTGDNLRLVGARLVGTFRF